MSEFEYENKFYHTSNKERLYKVLTQHDIFKQTLNVPGEIVECGVFKGASLIRLATFRDYHGLDKKVVGFDTFSKYPEAKSAEDKAFRSKFVEESGINSIDTKELYKILDKKGIKNVSLIKGDICETIPRYVDDDPDLRISLINMDVDLYEPTMTALEWLWPKLCACGILILDDYDKFPGETNAVNDYFEDKRISIKKYRGLHFIEK